MKELSHKKKRSLFPLNLQGVQVQVLKKTGSENFQGAD